jgi:3-isopropylmalate/(R)-2-methylmalate dehydratase small subunit
MKDIIHGSGWVFGDGISTDHITPGRYYHLRGDIPALAEHTLEDADPAFAQEAQAGEIVVAGENFGQGSSREHAALVLKERGIPVVLARSFARIFYRNAVNVGLIPITCDTAGFQTGDELKIDLEKGLVENLTQELQRDFAPLPAIMNEILQSGGLVAYVREKGGLR